MAFDPVSLAIGGVSAIAQGIFGGIGQSQQNAAAKRQAAAINASNMQSWKYQNKEMRRKFNYDTESIKIQRSNIEQELAYNDETAKKSWNYQMQIRAFDYDNRVREYEQRKLTAGQQLGFNNFAYDFALQDAARWEEEQNVALDFEEKSTMMEFKYAQLGQAMNFQEADAVRQQTRGMAQIEQQKAYVQGLKAAGEAQVRGGMGVGAEKAAAASIAETALTTSAIIQQVFNAEQSFGLTSAEIATNLEQINDKFYLDKAQITASRVSLGNQAKALRVNAAMSKFQADLNALSSIGFGPRIPPAPPKPEALPRPVLQDPFKPKPLPKPIANVPYTVSPILAGLTAAAPGLANAVVNSYNPSRIAQQVSKGGNTYGPKVFPGVQPS